MSEPVPLTAEDRAILELEGPTVAGHTCKVIELEAPGVELQALRDRVGERITREPLLRCRLTGEGEALAWLPDPAFAIERQVVAALDLPGADPATLAAEIFERRLDRELPLWRIDLAPLDGGGAALIWRIHHALADGTTAMRFARQLLWDEPVGGAKPATSTPTVAAGSAAAEQPPRAQTVRPVDQGANHAPADQPADDPAVHETHQSAADDHHRRRGHLAAFLKREFADSIRRSPFDGEVGARRSVAFTSVGFRPLHDAAKRICGATVNDAVLAVVAGAVRRWVEHHHGALGSVRFRVPVSLHSEGDDAGNRDSFFTLPVHLDEPETAARLEAIHEAATERKSDHDAERLEALLASLESHAPPLAGLAKRLEASPRSFALCVSNVPGPREPHTVLGAPVRSLHSIAEVGRRHGLRVAVVSYAGELCFGICADPAIADDLDAMAAGIGIEAEALISAD